MGQYRRIGGTYPGVKTYQTDQRMRMEICENESKEAVREQVRHVVTASDK